MNQDFILGKLSQLMGWEDERARDEFAWLRLMSRMKYDGYQDFLAGIRFIESLADWLQQFTPAERPAAYDFVRRRLVFVGPGEMRHLVELLYPETVRPRLVREVAGRQGIPPYLVWSTPAAVQLFERLRRKTLFIELSDGARIDVFRRANAGVVGNEQVVTAPRINELKWNDLLKDLRKATGDPSDRFAFVYLIDDFVGSGTTLLRKRDGEWSGKLVRFWEDLTKEQVLGSHFEPGWVLCVHHYLANHQADGAVRANEALARQERGAGAWFDRVEFSAGVVLPRDLPVELAALPDFAALVRRCYDDVIEDRHMRVGGTDARLGFGACALPLVLEHNTPNNSIALLWAETEGGPGRHAMRPLFRRRQRHS